LLDEILRVEGLSKQFSKKNMFGSKTSVVKAVEDVSFSLHNDEVLVIAGESGSGKSTIAKLILRAITPDSGKVIFQGEEIKDDSKSLLRVLRSCILQFPKLFCKEELKFLHLGCKSHLMRSAFLILTLQMFVPM